MRSVDEGAHTAPNQTRVGYVRGKKTSKKKGVELAGLLGGVYFQSEHFRQIIEKLPVAIYTTDASGLITYFNEAAAALWGRAPTIGEEYWCGSWRLYWPDGRLMAHEDCPLAQTLKTGRPVLGAQAIAERPDGSRFVLIPYPSPLFDASGELVGAINTLFDAGGLSASSQAVQHLAAIVQSSDDAIISKDLNGTITSWNEAAERLFGYNAPEMIGKSILTIIPRDRYHEEDAIIGKIRRGERTDHYETVRQRKDGSFIDVSLTVSPVKDEFGRVQGASKIARDISQRKLNEENLKKQARRLAALYRVSRVLSRDLDLDRIAQAIINAATELSGAKFGAFFSTSWREGGEECHLEATSRTNGEAIEKIVLERRTPLFDLAFLGRDIVRSDDIGTDPRFREIATLLTSKDEPPAIRSYLAVPIISSGGNLLGGLFLAHDESDVFQEETESLIASVALQAAVAMDNAQLHRATEAQIAQRRKAEMANEFLVNEIKHRVKNTLGTVQAMAVQTFRKAPADERNAFLARLHSLAEAYEVLTQRDWGSVALNDVANRALLPFVDSRQSRVTNSGINVELSPNRALLVAMVLHELGTNAVKYGALSNETGRIELVWDVVARDGEQRLTLDWWEQGGPPVSEPSHRGFGSRMIDHAMRGEQGEADFQFVPEGLRCRIEMPILARLRRALIGSARDFDGFRE